MNLRELTEEILVELGLSPEQIALYEESADKALASSSLVALTKMELLDEELPRLKEEARAQLIEQLKVYGPAIGFYIHRPHINN